MDETTAREIVKRYVDQVAKDIGMELRIVDANTIERDFGWVFFYDSDMYLESGSISDALAGNAPVIVDRRDGSLHETGTAHPIEHYIEIYQRHGTCHPEQ